jgi:uncharacterized tellurite resistance protein B-like protein
MSEPTPTELEALKLAFKKGLLDELSVADQELTVDERVLIDTLAPPAELERHGLLEGRELSAKFHALYREARHRLSTLLPLEERLALVTGFLELCVVDGELHRDEGSLLWEAATQLGIDGHAFDAHLDSLEEHVGGVELGDPE